MYAILVNICSYGSGWKSTLISRFKSLFCPIGGRSGFKSHV